MRRRLDEGFTLIETLITVAMVLLFVGVIGQVLFTAFRTTDDTRVRLSESSDAQFISSYLVPDLQSVDPGGASKAENAAQCGNAADGDNVLELAWTDDANDVSFVASYRFNDGKLVRYFCTPAGTVTRTNILAEELESALVPGPIDGPRITMLLVEKSGLLSYEVSGIRRGGGTRGGTGGGTDGTTDGTSDGTTDSEPPPCTGTISIPPSVKLKKGGSGHLESDVVVTANVSATCEPLHLHFDTGQGEETPALDIVDPGNPRVRQFVIATNAYRWSEGDHEIALHRADHDTSLHLQVLRVTK